MRNDGELILSMGVSRSGKSVLVKRIAEQFERVMAFDPKGEYVHQMGYEACLTPAEFIEKARATKGTGKLAFVASDPKSFELFCEVAFTFNREAPALIIPEELAAVTGTAKAQGAWGKLINQGLAFGPTILGTVQRGQEVDKSIMNNATYLHICMHNTDDDAAYIAKKLGIDMDVVPRKPLDFIQWRSGQGLLCSGKIDFVGAKSKHWQEGSPRFLINNQPKKLNKTRFSGVKYS
ncbi:hypothetical protein QF117_09195 [Vibrio sp. YMD68]|uniref:hypothetical protein n=1 Tax=Vibrio sp. YMD68 TaxID=3042300 RepID=UPI00249B43C8|nr:hypothetical protein [Vibrio sp. YMD68]WGW00342.1 hypothetical protein QF117_21180 [Vibrio sp. YMD68]WGW00977.1 hypothetical protein QF117_09195 [Vibrio sp. YMD68]